MTDEVRVVEEDVKVEAVPLNPGLCQATKVIRRLAELGFWKSLRSRVHLRRRACPYQALDLILFVVSYFASGHGKGFKKFALETAGETGRGLAGLVGRLDWMVQSGVSRALKAVCDACLQELVEVMREIWPKALELQKLSALGYRDAFDHLWQVIHYDGSVLPVRQRQLPKGDDLPAPRRFSRSIAAGGYPGRKRAEAVVQRALTQDAHSTWWVSCDVEPGNGDASAMALVGAGEAASHTATGSQKVRAVFVADGGGGGWAPLRAAIETGLYGLVRCSVYQWLDKRGVRKRLYEKGWYAVSDSRSGPSRSAKELGIWRDPSGHLYRVVVSRFASTEATTERGGAGREIRGWHYELFLTDLPADAWPAHDVVTLYYDRCGQENRFAMLNRRYHLNRVLCYHKEGQALLTLVALLVWNVEVLLGAEALGPWDEEHPDLCPKPRDDIPVSPPEPEVEQPDAEDGSNTAPELGATAKSIESIESALEPSDQHRTIEQALARKRQDWLAKHPDWTEQSSTLVCPAGTPMTTSLLDSTDTSVTIRFRAPANACRGCLLRGGCTSSVKTKGFRKELRLKAKAERVTDEELATLTFYRRDASTAPPCTTALTNGAGAVQCAISSYQPGPYACRMSRLCVGELLRLHDESSHSTKYAIEVQVPEQVHGPLPPAIAPTPAQRQRRRKTFAERIAWNDLPSGSTVRLLTIRRESRVDDSQASRIGRAA